MFAGFAHLVQNWKTYLRSNPSPSTPMPAFKGMSVCEVGLDSRRVKNSAGDGKLRDCGSYFAGSGSIFALGAWEKEKHAIKAVEFAMNYDPATGGSVKYFDASARTHNLRFPADMNAVQLDAVLAKAGQIRKIDMPAERNPVPSSVSERARPVAANSSEFQEIRDGLSSGAITPSAASARLLVWTRIGRMSKRKALEPRSANYLVGRRKIDVPAHFWRAWQKVGAPGRRSPCRRSRKPRQQPTRPTSYTSSCATPGLASVQLSTDKLMRGLFHRGRASVAMTTRPLHHLLITHLHEHILQRRLRLGKSGVAANAKKFIVDGNAVSRYRGASMIPTGGVPWLALAVPTIRRSAFASDRAGSEDLRQGAHAQGVARRCSEGDGLRRLKRSFGYNAVNIEEIRSS